MVITSLIELHIAWYMIFYVEEDEVHTKENMVQELYKVNIKSTHKLKINLNTECMEFTLCLHASFI